jgi:hypothetical protein
MSITDGRFDMEGDFAAATAKPTVWWIEGIAEYLSLKTITRPPSTWPKPAPIA